eukprot:TRINITY_DN74198_c0_g1_i1.p1 TRINITY_DN74198_c0_g1~~TRINITY_DN74198_c0_g1_i1.p1  ORF type:complete len:190 (+),score=52.66 TRINITY_DN74198_c0_g1_i1:61-630(+)
MQVTAESQLKRLIGEKSLFEGLLAIFAILLAFSGESQTGYGLFFIGHIFLSLLGVCLVYVISKVSKNEIGEGNYKALLFFYVLITLVCLTLDTIATLISSWKDWGRYYNKRIGMPTVFLIGALEIISAIRPIVWIPLFKCVKSKEETQLPPSGVAMGMPVTNDPSQEQSNAAEDFKAPMINGKDTTSLV